MYFLERLEDTPFKTLQSYLERKHLPNFVYLKMILHNCSHVIKGQLVNEDHLTFVDQHGKYLDHTTISDKRAVTQHGKLMDVLKKYDSKETLEILKTDGENANRCGTCDYFFASSVESV